jgi:hypothetical protein
MLYFSILTVAFFTVIYATRSKVPVELPKRTWQAHVTGVAPHDLVISPTLARCTWFDRGTACPSAKCSCRTQRAVNATPISSCWTGLARRGTRHVFEKASGALYARASVCSGISRVALAVPYYNAPRQRYRVRRAQRTRRGPHLDLAEAQKLSFGEHEIHISPGNWLIACDVERSRWQL